MGTTSRSGQSLHGRAKSLTVVSIERAHTEEMGDILNHSPITEQTHTLGQLTVPSLGVHSQFGDSSSET